MKYVRIWLICAFLAGSLLTACSGGKDPAAGAADVSGGENGGTGTSAAEQGVGQPAEEAGKQTEVQSEQEAEEQTGGQTAETEAGGEATSEAEAGSEVSPEDQEPVKRKFKGRISNKPLADVGEPVWSQEGAYMIGSDNFTSLQGGCTDGEYIYIAEVDQAHTGVGIIHKISPETWETVATSEVLGIGHANDVEYNSKTNELLVIPTNTTQVIVVDPETLTISRTFDTGYAPFGLTYNEKTDTYAAALNSGHIVFLNADFERIGMTNEYYPLMTQANLDSDENYIYLSQSMKNCIICFTWDGEYAGAYYMSDQDTEAEAVFHVDGQFYMTFWQWNSGSPISTICPIEMDPGILSTTGPDVEAAGSGS